MNLSGNHFKERPSLKNIPRHMLAADFVAEIPQVSVNLDQPAFQYFQSHCQFAGLGIKRRAYLKHLEPKESRHLLWKY